MNQAREAYTLTLLADGRALAVGGLSGDGTSTAAVDRYDPGTGLWTRAAALPAPRWSHISILLPDGGVLVAGGYDGTDTITASAVRYDPATNTWASTTPLGRSRTGAVAAPLADGRVLVIGGTSHDFNAMTPRSAEVYDPATGTWTPTGAMLRPRPSGHTATALADGRVLVVGGDAASGAQSEVYDPATNAFGTGRAPAVPGRTGHTATRLLDGRVLLTGGMTSSGVTPRAELYDSSSHAWSETGSLSTPRREHVAVLQADGSVLVAAGVGERSGDLWATSEVFYPPQGTWSPGASLPEPLANPAAVRLATDQVLLSGGKNEGGKRPTAVLSVGTLCPVTSGEYKYPPAIDLGITSFLQVQYWARLYRPQTLIPGRRYPLVVIIHGRHPPCGKGSNPRVDDETFVNDACPAGYTEVPNHDGYGYLAHELARRGILSLSVNWNRLHPLGGDEEDPLYAGPLVLKHLVRLSRWHAGLEPTPASLGVSLAGQVDFSNVLLVGHSRGGPISFYVREKLPGYPGLTEPVTVKGLFAIGATDTLNESLQREPRETAGVFLIPMCDMDGGDQSMMIFDRLLLTQAARPENPPRFKATYTVWGANHNFYNTEWQQSDNSFGCNGHPALFEPLAFGSVVQRQTAVRALMAFALGTLGPAPDTALTGLFDPVTFRESEWPRIDRGYIDAASPAYSRELENFSRPTGTNMSGAANDSANISLTHTSSRGQPGMGNHAGGLRFARISWSSAGTGTYFQSNFVHSGSGLDLSGFSTLDFRVERVPESALNSTAFPTWFEVQLVGPGGVLSNGVPMLFRARLTEPVGATPAGLLKYFAFLQTVRIPLASFSGVPRSSVHGVRFTFSGSASGELYLADLRAGRPAP
jgi:hypothetical protein